MTANPRICPCGRPMTSHAGYWICQVCDEPWRVD